MDMKYINPFIQAFFNIMPQLGFSCIEKESISVEKTIESKGIIINLGIVGDVKGNVVYIMDMESGKKVASKMMRDMAVNKLDDMAQSALSELTNMLTANASINFSNTNINVNISTPTLIYGEGIKINMNTKQIINVKLLADEIPVDVNISLQEMQCF